MFDGRCIASQHALPAALPAFLEASSARVTCEKLRGTAVGGDGVGRCARAAGEALGGDAELSIACGEPRGLLHGVEVLRPAPSDEPAWRMRRRGAAGAGGNEAG